MTFRLRGSNPLRPGVPAGSAISSICNFPSRLQPTQGNSCNPAVATPARNHTTTVWADPLSLAATEGVHFSLLSAACYDVPVRPLTFPALCVLAGMPEHYLARVSPFGTPRV